MKTQFFQSVPTLQSERLILRRLTQADAGALDRVAHSEVVYRCLPAFLYEQKYPDIHRVMDGLYDECLRESLILGIFLMEGESFCGLAEMYGLRNAIHKVSIGYRLAEPYWSKGDRLGDRVFDDRISVPESRHKDHHSQYHDRKQSVRTGVEEERFYPGVPQCR